MHRIDEEKINKYLDELGEEYKQILLDETIKRSDYADGLSVSEMLRIDDDVKKYIKGMDETRKKRRLYVFGMTYVMMGVLIYLLVNIMYYTDDLNYITPSLLIKIMSLIMTMVGVMICMLAYIRENYKTGKNYTPNNDKDKRKLLEYEVISIWRELEGICYDMMPGKIKKLGAVSVIKFLRENELVEQEECEKLTDFLRIRNIIVHENNINIALEDIEKEIECVQGIVGKLQDKLC